MDKFYQQQHPITPPLELVQWWRLEAVNQPRPYYDYIATQAARWGADQELEACCHLLRQQGFDVVDDLRATRRPKPPSLKEQALEELKHWDDVLGSSTKIIRRALEALPE